jgi:ABC-type sugar transport system ATPase subunit
MSAADACPVKNHSAVGLSHTRKMPPTSNEAVALNAHRNSAAPPEEPLAKHLLFLWGVRKRYSGFHARGGDFRVPAPGTTHTLFGEDGSGEPTLLGVLSGSVQTDPGVMYSEGRELAIGSPSAAVIHGTATVSQEAAVAPDLPVADNVLFGRLPRRRRWVDWQTVLCVPTARLLAHLGIACDPRTVVTTLVSDHHGVEIARDSRWLPLSERGRGPDRTAGALLSAFRS